LNVKIIVLNVLEKGIDGESGESGHRMVDMWYDCDNKVVDMGHDCDHMVVDMGHDYGDRVVILSPIV
jgi:hypothetical protein